MSIGGQKRTRSERVASIELPPGRVMRWLISVRRRDVALRIALCLLATAAIAFVSRAWETPFGFRKGYCPRHDILSRAKFESRDPRRDDLSRQHDKGELLATANHPLGDEDLRILLLEHKAHEAGTTMTAKVARTAAVVVLVLAMYCLCGYYVARTKRRPLDDLKRFCLLQAIVILAVGIGVWLSRDPWRAELIPLLLLGITVTIAFGQRLALVISLAVALIVALATGGHLGEFVLLLGGTTTAVLLCGRVRSRSKLIKVGLLAGGVSLVLTLVAGILDQQPLSVALWTDAGRNALWGLGAGFLIAGLLPFVESLFGVLTDISLLELGDVAHPLLQELVRRAPGTYNHSINVASLAEAAADAIGANGLLARVGAYFHDIGKMLKPGYFVENIGNNGNRHDALVPTMSTLIIIAHIKDGADLARQHHLPDRIVDFIEQHHGTTLVEYFFHRASEQHEADGNGATVEESAFRYPGPKPQTKEAGVLMLADAVEGAARVLVEPAPARIESLVNEIAMSRLHDGQFDESGLNLTELRAVQDSLSKSLTAMYHGRLKYPSQRTA